MDWRTYSAVQEIKNWEVTSALYYYDADCCLDIRTYLNNILKDKGGYKYNYSTSSFIDNRSHCFFLFPLNNFLHPLITKRKSLKNDLKKSENSQKKGMQVLLKYCVNTLWGWIASVYFPINNVIISEQVTNNIRFYVYMISKVWNCFQNITDGGAYCLNEICYWKSKDKIKKPGLSVFTSFEKRKNHPSPSIVVKFFNDIDWDFVFENNFSLKSHYFENLDIQIKTHISEFWSFYQVPFEIDVEHKYERFSKKFAYIYKAHYAMLTFDFVTNQYTNKLFVIRGFRFSSEITYVNPIYTILNLILDSENGKNVFFEDQNNYIYQERSLLKINSWNNYLIQNKLSIQYLLKKQNENIPFPGDEFYSYKLFRLNNLYFPINSLKDFQKKNRRSLRIKNIILFENKEIKLRQELFEKYFKQGLSLDKIIQKMVEDKL